MKNKRFYIKLAFNILRVIIPVGLLIIIFLNIDLKALAEAFRKVDLKYFFLSILFANILQVIVGATRWYYMVRKDIRQEKTVKYISNYWSAMFYGYFVPSNVGMDVYRVSVAGKKLKNYEQHIVTLIGEKIYTLVISILILFISYAVVYREIKGSEVSYSLDVIAAILILISVVIIILFMLFRRRFSTMVNYLKNRFYHYARVISLKLSSKIPLNFTSFSNELPYIFKKEFISKTLLFTILLRVLLAVGSYFLFLAFGIRLSFWVLLFANTAFFLLFILPISFGSLGVREGAYIVIFGLFGVNPETALAASFLALAGLVFTVSIGGIISLTENFKKIKIDYGE